MNDRPVFDYEYYKRSADYIRKQIGDFKPKTGIILGTGLGDVADLIEAECYIHMNLLHKLSYLRIN